MRSAPSGRWHAMRSPSFDLKITAGPAAARRIRDRVGAGLKPSRRRGRRARLAVAIAITVALAISAAIGMMIDVAGAVAIAFTVAVAVVAAGAVESLESFRGAPPGPFGAAHASDGSLLIGGILC